MNRREFLKSVGLAIVGTGELLLTSCNLLDPKTKSIRQLAHYGPYEKQAIEKGKIIGIGSARLEGPRKVEVATYQTLKIVYTAGKAGVKPGGGIRIGLRHLFNLWSTVQKDDPASDGFLTVESINNVPGAPISQNLAKWGPPVSVSVECNNYSPRFLKPYFPWQNIVEVIVAEPGLRPGQRLTITYGDKSSGSQGFRIQPFDESPFFFKTYVDALGDGEYLPIANSPSVEIVAAEPHRLSIIAASNAIIGEPNWCVVRAEDRFGNPATRYRGTVALKSTDNSAKLPTCYTFTKIDRGVHRFENVVLNTQGHHTMSVEDGIFECESNPVTAAKTRTDKLLLWGDLHGHTLFSDGRGTVEQYYDFAERVAALDFCAVSDHAFEVLDEMWAHSKAVTNRLNKPGRFVTFNAYEWSGRTKVGGDHNVYWLDDDPPIYRCNLLYSTKNLQMYHGPEPKVNHIEDLFRILERHYLKNKNVFCIPHLGGRRANPKWHNPKIQRLIEIFSEHRRSEEWATQFLKNGYRLGIIASTDGHYGNPGYGFLKPTKTKEGDIDLENQETGMALIAVLAEQHTRKSIFTALYDRHCYATTGDRIILDFRADGHIMGSEYKASNPPTITIKAVGTAVMSRLEIKKNSRMVYLEQPSEKTIKLQWQDPDFQPDQQCYYTIHITQANNEQAISSPIWVN